MAASYPSSAKAFTPLVDGSDYPQATQVNQVYDEVTALEAALVTSGLAHALIPDSSGAARTLGSTAKFWGLTYLKGLTVAAAAELTIASGVVTCSQGYHRVDTEADAASDDLDTITAGAGFQEGSIVIIRAENVARVVTIKDGTGNLLLNGDCALSATDRTLTLLYDGTNWRELARSFVSPATLSNAGVTGVSVDATGFVDSATQPRCVAFHSTTQSIASTTAALALDSEDVDVGTMHDLVTNNSRVTIPTGGDGLYWIHGRTFVATADNVALHLRKNGTTVLSHIHDDTSNTANLTLEVSALLVLAAADYVDLLGEAVSSTVPFGSATAAKASRLSVVKLW